MTPQCLTNATIPSSQAVPRGFCECRCGGRTQLARSTSHGTGRIAGEPLRFITGHQNRKQVRWVEQPGDRATPCHVWQLARNTKGYGAVKVAGQTVLAHRVAYESRYGELDDDVPLDHLCRTRACINPEHLEPVTNAGLAFVAAVRARAGPHSGNEN